ncbi:AMP-binding protein [Nocardia higoensis]|uniref:AMP-binding protein n=1 Tax=Nocardia higoensis TaxID=228599 RepID=A0ABS0D6E0_9NOCA|nr:long-chain-fatty-acid--CoA ligase [Nocardia higoensis]MBF6354042.1 AMP-binding protein [Nocardia higoensis]
MSRITDLLFRQPAPEDTGLWSGESSSELSFLSWAQVRSAAATAAAGLADAGVVPGDSVAILAGGAEDVTVTVQASWMRGASFTMLHQPTPRTNLETWLADCREVVRMLGSRAVAVGQPFFDAVRELDLGAPIVSIDEIRSGTAQIEAVGTDEEDLAVLQLTSGTTGVPKAVAITYRNLWANHRAMVQAADLGADDVVVSWLPLYHDMGMIGTLMTPMFARTTTVITTPMAFLKNPLSWAELFTRFGGTFTAAPNFAYSVLARRLRRAPDGAYDLSTLRVAVNGAEAIDTGAVEEFLTEGARFGLQPEAMMPAYGMAETTLAVSFSAHDQRYTVDVIDADRAERDNIAAREDIGRERTVVRLGPPVPGLEMRVVDEEGNTLPADHIGTFQVRGEAVTRRYLGPDGFVAANDAEGWLDTGDLGYLTADGEAVVSGRKKDIIIVAGRNISPVVVERAAGVIPGVRAGGVAALAVKLPPMAREGIAVIAESDAAGDAEESERIRKEVARAVYDDVGIAPAVVTIVGKGALPKTPSGKLRRAASAGLITA